MKKKEAKMQNKINKSDNHKSNNHTSDYINNNSKDNNKSDNNKPDIGKENNNNTNNNLCLSSSQLPSQTTPQLRIAKKIASLGVCSRREAERLILEGRIKIDNQIVITPVFFVDENCKIELDNKIISNKKNDLKFYKFYKPIGCLTTRNDPMNRQTVYDFLGQQYRNLIYIGRLDYNSEGLLLFTNNGKFSRILELPSSKIPRTYRVKIFGTVSSGIIDKIQNGLMIDGFQYGKNKIANVKYAGSYTWLEMTLFEGKNREIRTIFEHFDFQITRLIRILYANVSLEKMKEEEFCELSTLEYEALMVVIGK